MVRPSCAVSVFTCVPPAWSWSCNAYFIIVGFLGDTTCH